MNQKILGDKRKSNFDDNLHEIVNKMFESMPDEELEKGVVKLEERKVFRNLGMGIFVPERTKKSTNEWSDYFENIKTNQGKSFACMPHYYSVLTRIKRYLEEYKYDKEITKFSSDVLKGLIENSEILLSGTILTLNQSNTKRTIVITHKNSGFNPLNHGVNNQYITLMNVVDYVKDPERENFLQHLFLTRDGGNEIVEVLKLLYPSSSDKIRVILPSFQTPETVYGCGFAHEKDRLLIRCDIDVENERGYARGLGLDE